MATAYNGSLDVPRMSSLVSHIFIADPSAHVFNNSLYLYPSHDRNTTVNDTSGGGGYDMYDYHVFSMQNVAGIVNDYGVGLSLDQVPWAVQQAWAPDAAYKDGTYYLYFPAKDDQEIFRMGVASSDRPEGPFTPDQTYINGSYSIDPAVFTDADGSSYMYFGGIWGGQLQCWINGTFDASQLGDNAPSGEGVAALSPKVVRMSDDMRNFNGSIMDAQILVPENGTAVLADDHDRRFFEAPWVHTYNGTYYLSYSTGDTHFLVYATADNPMGPFTYRGRLLEPVVGWTTHHSIVEYHDRWYLFYADASLSGGVDKLRTVKVAELQYDAEGNISLTQPQY